MSRFLRAHLLAFLTPIVFTLGCSEDMPSNKSHDQNDPMAAYNNTRVGHYGYGLPANKEQIAGWDIDIRPDGVGLPEGSGSVEDGEYLYEDKCVHCHGTFGEGEGRYPVLAGGQGSLKEARPTKTVGSYWPYTSTLYDYIYRAMPFTQPESLSPDETYAITAYVLYLNDLVEDDFVLSRENLASVHLPNEGNFIPDSRPDVANVRCMENCRDPKDIKILSEVASSTTVQGGLKDESMSKSMDQHAGQATYEQYCSICHAIGVAGAPKIGDALNWEPRIEKGIDRLISNAINGVTSNTGTMPPKGGFAQLTDNEVSTAVHYMVEAWQ